MSTAHSPEAASKEITTEPLICLRVVKAMTGWKPTSWYVIAVLSLLLVWGEMTVKWVGCLCLGRITFRTRYFNPSYLPDSQSSSIAETTIPLKPASYLMKLRSVSIGRPADVQYSRCKPWCELEQKVGALWLWWTIPLPTGAAH
jgi:hypothetical protein